VPSGLLTLARFLYLTQITLTGLTIYTCSLAFISRFEASLIGFEVSHAS